MEKGMKALIYHKPVTGEDFDAVATLVEEVRPDCGDGLSLWMVNFNDGYGPVMRTVNKRDVIKPTNVEVDEETHWRETINVIQD